MTAWIKSQQEILREKNFIKFLQQFKQEQINMKTSLEQLQE